MENGDRMEILEIYLIFIANLPKMNDIKGYISNIQHIETLYWTFYPAIFFSDMIFLKRGTRSKKGTKKGPIFPKSPVKGLFPF